MLTVAGDSSKSFPDTPVDLVWTDPPFGTNKLQSNSGESYMDPGHWQALSMIVSAIDNVSLKETSVVCICADYRLVHELVHELSKNLMFRGEIIWSFGLGRPRTSWWPNRHNTIVTFSVSNKAPFDFASIPTERRKAPKPGYGVTKPVGSTWDFTMSNTSSERVGYPNQKPLTIIEPFILAHTQPNDVVADPFMGSGSTAHAAIKLGRRFVGQDVNPSAVKITDTRIAALVKK